MFYSIFFTENTNFLQIGGGFDEPVACIFISYTNPETVFTWN